MLISNGTFIRSNQNESVAIHDMGPLRYEAS